MGFRECCLSTGVRRSWRRVFLRSAGAFWWVKRVGSAVRPRFWLDVAGQTLRRVLRDRVFGVV